MISLDFELFLFLDFEQFPREKIFRQNQPGGKNSKNYFLKNFFFEKTSIFSKNEIAISQDFNRYLILFLYLLVFE